MQHYELLYIIPAKYAGDELAKIQNKVKDLIKKAEGQIDHEEDLGKKKLAYAIQHNTQGFYKLCEIDIETDKIKSLSEKIALISEVLRHLIIKKKKLTAEERAAEKTDKKDTTTVKESKMAGQFNIEAQLEDSGKKNEAEIKKLVPYRDTGTTSIETTTDKEIKDTADSQPLSKVADDEEKAPEKETEAEPKVEIKEKKKADKIKLDDLDKKLDEIIDESIL